MKKLHLVTGALMLLSFTYSGSFKLTQLSTNLEINMPGEPSKTMLSATAWRFQSALDDSTFFGAVINDNTDKTFTEKRIVDMTSALKTQMEQQKRRMEERGEKYISDTSGMYNEKEYVEIVVSNNKRGYDQITYGRTLYHKNYNVYLYYKSGKNGVDKKSKDQYFSSLKLLQ